MIRNPKSLLLDGLNRQGAYALLRATATFLQANNISKKLIVDCIRENCDSRKARPRLKQYQKLIRAYQDMGIVMSTWYSLPSFLDRDCRPVPLTIGVGAQSIYALVRAARVSISAKYAVDMMRRSPSIRIDSMGNLIPLRREFVIPDFEVIRAALVIERYLDTLHRNSARDKNSIVLLERSCHVPKVNVKTIAPVLRDIKTRGSAYIDSVNGDIESLRLKDSKSNGTGEMSVHIFAWTHLPRPRRQRRKLKTR